MPKRTWVPTVPRDVVDLLLIIDTVRLISQCERVGGRLHVTRADVHTIRERTRKAGL